MQSIQSRLNRRRFLALAGAAVAAPLPAFAAETLDFADLYGKTSVLGMAFSAKTLALTGQTVTMSGFMAPPLKAEAAFFVLTEIPMSLCPFCSSDADWPDNIVVVYLDERQTFGAAGRRIAVTGTLESGSWTDPATGFVSLLRLRHARFSEA